MTVQLIQAYYAAFNARDFAGMVALLSDDVAHDVNQGGRETGRAAFAQFLERMDASYREQLSEIVVMAEPGGKRFAAELIVEGEYLKGEPGFRRRAGSATACRWARSSRSRAARSRA